MSINYEVRKNRITCHKGHCLQIGAHLHSHLEIVLLLEGHSDVWIDGSEYSLVPGDLFIAFPNQVHCYSSHEYEDYWLLIIPEEMCKDLNSWINKCVPKCPVLHRDQFPYVEILQLAGQIESVNGDEPSELNQIISKGYILSLLGLILSNLQLVEEKMQDVSVMKQMLGFCAANFAEDLSLEVLEKELHINRYYISHLFSQKLKIKFNDYVNSLRIAEACKLLRETDRNITDIFNVVGFSSARTFNRAFLKLLDETPSTYRKNYRKS